MSFDPLTQESLIQKRWADANAFRAPFSAEISTTDKTFYMLVMLPYPSGRIHMGHVRNYTLGDVIARFRRMCGYRVLNPIGWDSFGLPAENAAIKHHVHPALWTRNNIQDMKKQIQSIGISYDWDREIATFLPDYYRWNQWFFLKMWNRGDVFRALRNVNWCEALGTVLANEQVIDGKDERTGHSVVQKPMKQYFFATTRYADELLSGHKNLDWPDSVKTMQRHWIGRSDGVRVIFKLTNEERLQIFTTRLDTIYGATFIALSVEHPIIQNMIVDDCELGAFCSQVAAQSREERLMSDIKLGYLSGLKAIHPFTGDVIPVFAANYVFMDYGTGAVMGVPAHDERDLEFANKYNIPISKVIEGENAWAMGTLVDSGEFTGMTSEQAVPAMLKRLGDCAEVAVAFKLKDWGISRQRYWGTPIPMVHCNSCGVVPEKECNLPIILPEDIAFSGKGASPITRSESFLSCVCPQCGGPGQRETDTMDTFVDSSWYWMRYTDPHNSQEPFSKAEADAWSPVDLYIGGIEHATMHLIYARYFYKVMRDLGMVSGDEPFKKLICQGMVLKDGFKMSKSKGNIVDPDEVIATYGADALRLFITFAAPIEKEIDWTGFEGIEGATRFLRRITRMVEDHTAVNNNMLPTKEFLSSDEVILLAKVHQTLYKVTDDLSQRYQFNTIVSSLMELANAIAVLPKDAPNRAVVMQETLKIFILMLSPVAPHLAEQLWTNIGGKGLCMQASWPVFDPAWATTDEVTMVVQVNGKMRGRVVVPTTASEELRRQFALNCKDIQRHIVGKSIVKVVIPTNGKLVNIVIAD